MRLILKIYSLLIMGFSLPLHVISCIQKDPYIPIDDVIVPKNDNEEVTYKKDISPAELFSLFTKKENNLDNWSGKSKIPKNVLNAKISLTPDRKQPTDAIRYIQRGYAKPVKSMIYNNLRFTETNKNIDYIAEEFLQTFFFSARNIIADLSYVIAQIYNFPLTTAHAAEKWNNYIEKYITKYIDYNGENADSRLRRWLYVGELEEYVGAWNNKHRSQKDNPYTNKDFDWSNIENPQATTYFVLMHKIADQIFKNNQINIKPLIDGDRSFIDEIVSERGKVIKDISFSFMVWNEKEWIKNKENQGIMGLNSNSRPSENLAIIPIDKELGLKMSVVFTDQTFSSVTEIKNYLIGKFSVQDVELFRQRANQKQSYEKISTEIDKFKTNALRWLARDNLY